MHRLLALSIATLLSACDAALEKALDLVAKQDPGSIVVLSKQVALTSSPLTLTPPEPMKVFGQWTSVCLSLRGGVPMQDTKVMDRLFEEAMRDAKVQVELTLANGERVSLRRPLPAWSLRGKLVEREELAACASTPCKAELPIGAVVTKVVVSAEPSLEVHGVYWQSEADMRQKPAPGTKVAASASASAPNATVKCAA